MRQAIESMTALVQRAPRPAAVDPRAWMKAVISITRYLENMAMQQRQKKPPRRRQRPQENYSNQRWRGGR